MHCIGQPPTQCRCHVVAVPRNINSGEPSGFYSKVRVQRDQIELSLTYGKGCSPQVRSLQEAAFQEPLNHSAGIGESDFGTGDVPQKRHHE
jgi:hypothetical protein